MILHSLFFTDLFSLQLKRRLFYHPLFFERWSISSISSFWNYVAYWSDDVIFCFLIFFDNCIFLFNFLIEKWDYTCHIEFWKIVYHFLLDIKIIEEELLMFLINFHIFMKRILKVFKLSTQLFWNFVRLLFFETFYGLPDKISFTWICLWCKFI